MEKRTLSLLKDVLWAVVFAGLFAIILRLGLGLGAATGLNDASPWGLWIAFKLCFVALAGGGFTLAALVYVFKLESYRPVLRRAILLALLGYGSFIFSLLFDLGLPWRIYMPIISWQHHSVMFEIAWCVMLYFSVLIMEFGPVILEHPWFQSPLFQKTARALHLMTPVLIIAGIVLSTLHQSSLGALFLIMPHRVHPLWYSPLIPVLFFTSSIAAGLMALVVDGFLSEKLFGRGLTDDLLARMAKNGGFVLWLYLGIRLVDLTVRGVLPGALDGSWQSLWFGAEILIGGILPAALLLVPEIRSRRAGLLTCSLLAIAGVISQRMSLSMLTMWRPESAPYRPSLFEIVIAFAIPAAAGLIYLLFSQHLKVHEETSFEPAPAPSLKERFDPHTRVYRQPGWQYQLVRRSGIAVLVVALAVAALPSAEAGGKTAPASPVQESRGWDTITIDGDGDGAAVQFPHLEHHEYVRILQLTSPDSVQQKNVDGTQLSRTEVCQTCHHINPPEDEGTACSDCHSDNYVPQSIFNHTMHTAAHGGNASCVECHQGEHRAQTAAACVDCHEDMTSEPGEATFSYLAPGFQDAMHENCRTCHEEQAGFLGKEDLAACSTCHYNLPDDSSLAEAAIWTSDPETDAGE